MDFITRYCAKGFYLFPVSKLDKKPLIKNNLKSATINKDIIKAWAQRFPDCNWGLALAPSGLMAVDVDIKHGGLDLWDDLTLSKGHLETLTQITGSGGYHFIYRDNGDTFRGQYAKGIDIKHNGYIVIAPSVNQQGNPYKWRDLETTIQNIKDHWIYPFISKKHKPEMGAVKEEEKTLLDLAKEAKAPDLNSLNQMIEDFLEKEIEITREEWITLAMALKHWDEHLGLDLFLKLSRGPSYVPGDEEKIIGSIWPSIKNDAVNPITIASFIHFMGEQEIKIPKRLKKDHAAGVIEKKLEKEKEEIGEELYKEKGGQFIFLEEEKIIKYFNGVLQASYFEPGKKANILLMKGVEGGLRRFSSFSQDLFKTHTAYMKYKFVDYSLANPKMKTDYAYRVWLESKGRAEINALRFLPGHDFNDDKILNLFVGFPCEEMEGDPTAILKMIEDSICNGDKKVSEWLLDFFAHMIQKPGEKPSVVPVLIGKQGTGKGILLEMVFGMMLGDMFKKISDQSRITARFNDYLENKLLLNLNEVTWRGHKTEDSFLKDLTSSPTIQIERKHGLIYDADNIMRVVVTSNNEEAVAMEIGNRRYVYVVANDELAGKSDYFNPIANKIRQGDEVKKFFRFLKERDIKGFNPFEIPGGNMAGEESKIASNGPVCQFWADVLYEAPIPIWTGKYILTSRAYDYFQEYSGRIKTYGRDIGIKKFLKLSYKIFGWLPTNKLVKHEGKVYRGMEINPKELVERFHKTLVINPPEYFDEADFLIGANDF